MQLSIGMIVKNEEKYLRRCLEALQPLLKNVDSELIIVDTGSTDRTVEIAKEFTDKVFFFEWINDFAAARNFGLEKAQGEWFMAVDADEIFLSCKDIISFFKSGEYKDYNSACFLVRSYTNPDRVGRYVDFFVPRLTKILPDTKYEGAVHEKITTFGNPVMLLRDIADHYGYIKAVNKDKAKRNAEILVKRLETEESNPSLYRELFEAFIAEKETEQQAYEYLEKGIELCRKIGSDYLLSLYHCHMALCVSRFNYEDAVKIYDEYFAVDNSIKNGTRNTDLDIVAFAALSLYKLNRYGEAYNMLKQYFDLYDLIERTNLNTRDMLYSYQYLSDENAYGEMHLYYVDCCIETNRLKDAEESLRRLSASAYISNRGRYLDRIRQCKLVAKKYDADTLAEKLIKSDSKLQKELFRGFRSMVFSMEENDRKKVIEKLEKANLKSAAQRKLVSIYKKHFLGKGAGDALLMEYAEKFGMDYPDIFIIMDRECMGVISYLSKCEDMELYIETGLKAVDGFYDVMAKLNYENVARGDILNSVKACFCVITELLNAKISALFLYPKIGNLGIKYLEAFGESNIPAEVMAAVTIAEINLLRSGRNFKGCLEALRRLIQMNKKYAPIAVEFQGLIKSDMNSVK